MEGGGKRHLGRGDRGLTGVCRLEHPGVDDDLSGGGRRPGPEAHAEVVVARQRSGEAGHRRGHPLVARHHRLDGPLFGREDLGEEGFFSAAHSPPLSHAARAGRTHWLHSPDSGPGALPRSGSTIEGKSTNESETQPIPAAGCPADRSGPGRRRLWRRRCGDHHDGSDPHDGRNNDDRGPDDDRRNHGGTLRGHVRVPGAADRWSVGHRRRPGQRRSRWRRRRSLRPETR